MLLDGDILSYGRGYVHARGRITGGSVVVFCPGCHGGDQTVDAALEFDRHMHAVWFPEI
jgi:hypothetical protein